MSTEGLDARPTDPTPVVSASTRRPGIATRSPLSRAADYLQDNVRIGHFFTNVPKYRRYVDLKRDQLFHNLVDLYTITISTHWSRLRRFVESYAPQGCTNLQRYAAEIYISAWFYDLYVSNRMACKKLSDIAYSEHYFMDNVYKLTEYDSFLTGLNSQIRPTNIKLTHEDTLYIPRIRSTIVTTDVNENMFNITGYKIKDEMLFGLVHLLRDGKLLKFEPLSENALGRPAWLFDWHNDNLCYAWFPAEANYTMDDVAYAYIIGVACTPKLAPRDYDEWQFLPGNVIPANHHAIQIRRIRGIAYHGAITARVIETREWQIPTSARTLITLDAEAAAPIQPALRQLPLTGGDVPPSTSRQRPPATEPRSTRQRTLSYNLRSTASQTGADGSEPAHSAAASQPIPEQEEGENDPQTEEVNQPTAEPNPQVVTGTTGQVNYRVTIPIFAQARIVDFIYHSRVININDNNARISAHRLFTKYE